jgi:hypothetical protein
LPRKGRGKCRIRDYGVRIKGWALRGVRLEAEKEGTGCRWPFDVTQGKQMTGKRSNKRPGSRVESQSMKA